MHRKQTILLVGLILLTLTSFGMSQQVDIDLIISPTLQNARVVYVSSFDLLQQGSTDFLFQLCSFASLFLLNWSKGNC